MLKFKPFFAAAVFLVVVPKGSLADCSGISCEDVTIDVISLRTDRDTIWISTTGDETQLGCIPEAGEYLRLDPTNAAGKNVLTAVLAAKVGNQSTDIRIEESTDPDDGCEIIYINLE